jgi:acetate kinase
VRVLVVNAGSSTLKLSLLDGEDRVIEAIELEAPEGRVDEDAVGEALGDGLGEADAVGHRIVHGGERFSEPVLINSDVEGALRGLVEMAPLHQPKSLAALDTVSRVLPGVPAVACFDTAFHATLSAAARTYALPATWRERWPVRRFGFHGLSHAWIARRAAELLGGPPAVLRIVSAHLGAGGSLCAIADGRSIDTTMGFTPLEGLVMATRSGSVDPGLLLWLLERTGIAEHELAEALERESGLLGLCGTADMRQVIARAAAGDVEALLALDVYVHRLRAGIAAMAAALGGLDALVFTGGVGERAPEVRARAVAGLGFLGLRLDDTLNRGARGDAEITEANASARVLVVQAREEVEIAAQVRATIGHWPPRRSLP